MVMLNAGHGGEIERDLLPTEKWRSTRGVNGLWRTLEKVERRNWLLEKLVAYGEREGHGPEDRLRWW